MSTQAAVFIDSAASATLSATAVIPVLNGAVTGTGSAIGAQTTLASLATFFATQPNPPTFSTPMTLGTVGAAFVIAGTPVAAVADTASGAVTFKANIGRGTGAVGGFVFQIPVTTGSGTTAQTLTNALTVGATTVPMVFVAGADVVPTGIISATNASLTTATQFTSIRAAAGALVHLVRVNGTLAAPTIITNADGLGTISFRGAFTATTVASGASVTATATEAWVASTASGCKLTFNVTPNTTTGVVLGMTLDQDKSLTVVGKLGVNGASAQAAASLGATLGAYGAGANGYDTAGLAQAIYNQVVAITAALKANGIGTV